MDRDEAIKLLHGGEDGVEEWNRRRKENPDVGPTRWRRKEAPE